MKINYVQEIVRELEQCKGQLESEIRTESEYYSKKELLEIEKHITTYNEVINHVKKLI